MFFSSAVLEEFFYIRLEFYEKRKVSFLLWSMNIEQHIVSACKASLIMNLSLQKVLLANLEIDMLKCDNKYRFIRCVVEGSIVVSNRKRADLFLELKEKGFTPFPKKKSAPDVAIAGAIDDAEETEENTDVTIAPGVSAGDYDYLLSLAIGTLTAEKMQELRDERDKLMQEVEELRKATAKSLWVHDLDALESKLIEVGAENTDVVIILSNSPVAFLLKQISTFSSGAEEW